MPSLVLATSNGTGMGHLARAAAMAMAADDHADAVLLSGSQALPLVRGLGLRGEYYPSQARKFLQSERWQRYFADRVVALVEETAAPVFAFDGPWPYHGLSYARQRLRDVLFVWVRRALWRRGANTAAFRHGDMFDLVLEPGDVASAADVGATTGRGDAVGIAPVTLAEQVPRLDRAAARAELGLDPERPTALLTLRDGAANGPAAAAARALAGGPWQIATTGPARFPGSTPLRSVFPLARYLAAFDIAVTEAGYNVVHEVLAAALASLLVPTDAAAIDDQHTRARWAAGRGVALTAAVDEPSAVADAVRRLTDADVRAELAAQCRQLPAMTGAVEAVDTLLDASARFAGHRSSARERAEIARRTIRPTAASLARRLGLPAVAQQLDPVAPAPRRPYRLVEGAAAGEIAVDDPVEDVLAGASSAYSRTRERIAAHHFGGASYLIG